MNLSDQERKDLLGLAQSDIFMRLYPVIIVFAVMGAAGIIGNILTIVFYATKSRRSPSTVQIVCLATVDLIVCTMIIPNIIEIAVNVNYRIGILCKLVHFIGLWSIECSCFILWIIAIDRHKKICRPFSKQMTIATTQHAITGLVVLAGVMSVRNFFNFDTVEVRVEVPGHNESVVGQFCTTRDDGGYKVSVSVFYACDIIFLLVCWITLFIVYSQITFTLLRLKRTNKHIYPKPHAHAHKKPQVEEITKDETETAYETQVSEDSTNVGLSEIGSTCPEMKSSNSVATINNNGVHHFNSLRKKVHHLNAKRKVRQRKIAAKSAFERNLTFTMLTVSILFVLCFVPYFVVKVIMRLVLNTGESFELSVGIQFALRLVYLNSVFNPFVYFIFNPRFRRFVKGLFLKCIKCKTTQ